MIQNTVDQSFLSPVCYSDEDLVEHLDGRSCKHRQAHLESCWHCRERLLMLNSELEGLRQRYQHVAHKSVSKETELKVLIGQFVGKYEILEEINAGGQGHVYRALDPELQREVAIKIGRKSVQNSPDGQSRIQQEGVFLAKIEHQNLARVYDFGIQQSHPYLVMEFVRGVNLQQLIATEVLKESQIRSLMSQVAAALSHCHSQGILHLDIKPENIMVSAEKHVTLIDFGVSWFLFQESPEYAVGGTLDFMSPEQLSGNVQEWSERTDIYGLGALLFFLATGSTLACEQHNDNERMAFVAKSLEKMNCSRLIKGVCMKSLAYDSADRYASARSFQTALSYRNKWIGGSLIVAGLLSVAFACSCYSAGQHYVNTTGDAVDEFSNITKIQRITDFPMRAN